MEEFAAGTLRYENGFTCQFKVAWAINQPELFDIRFAGSRAGLQVPSMTMYTAHNGFLSDDALRLVDENPYKKEAFPGHFHLFDNIRGVLRGENEALIRREEILNISAAIEAFYQSAELGREVSFAELAAE